MVKEGLMIDKLMRWMLMLKLLRECSVMKMASQEQQMKACCQWVGWKKKYLYGKNVRRKLMLNNFFFFIANRGYSDSYILSQREKKPQA